MYGTTLFSTARSIAKMVLASACVNKDVGFSLMYQDILEGIMMRGCRVGVCLIALVCWTSVAVGAANAGSEQKKPLTVEEMHKKSSAEMIMRTDATPEEDYQSGIIAYDRQELVEAQGLFERAAKKGHTGAMVRYAEILYRAGFIGEAAASYRQAAELGDPEGQFGFGMMYMDLGNYDWQNIDSKVKPIEARKWIMKSAEQGYKDAISIVALAYANGGLGLTDAERTDTEVLKWLNKAADAGNGTAMGILADAYRKGKYGLAVDNELANEWTTKARKASGIKEEDNKKKVKRKRRL